MIVMTVSAMEALYSRPPSSRNMADRKFIKTECLRGNLRHSARIACVKVKVNTSDNCFDYQFLGVEGNI